MKPVISFFIPDNATRVEIKELVPGCTEEMIRTALEEEFITTGIQWDRITQVIRSVNESGEVLRNVEIASVNNYHISVHCGKDGPLFTGNTVTDLYHDLSAIAAAFRSNDTETPLRNGIFVNAHEVALTVTIGDTQVNVFGNALQIPEKHDPLPRERCIALKSIPGGYQLVALVSGYFVINAQNAFDIMDPFTSSDDKMILYCRVIPICYGRDSFIDRIVTSIQESASSLLTITGNPLDLPATDHLVNYELRRGREPVAGTPGTIRFLINTEEQPRYDNHYRIDHREKSPYKEIQEGTVLAERIPLRQSIDGVDAYGDPVKISVVKDIIFSYGNGIIEESSPECIRYLAKEHGILEYNPHYLNVIPQLVIKGDVDTQTGNIKYSRSVLVQGNIASGFRVECGELTVRESIEDGAEVNCSGKLMVSKGILGERTRVIVSGDAKAGFVQGATMRIAGNCTINEYAYHAKIFCAKKLVINGKGIVTKSKGGTIGGTISSLECMELHSVGSCSTLTTLCCGFDTEGYSILLETINLEKILKKKIIQLQNTLQFNPSNKEMITKKIQNYSAEKKEVMKIQLLELRQTIEQVEKMDAKVALLSRKVFSSNIAESSILVHHHCIAPVLIEFPKCKRKLYRDTLGITVRLINNEIEIYEGMHRIDESTMSEPM